MSSFPFKTFLAALLASSCFVPVAQAATITWDGGAGTSSWFDANNWSGNALPTGADVVDLDATGVTASSSKANTAALAVGYVSTGSLTVLNGGVVSLSSGYDFYAGYQTGSVGTITVTGEESALEGGAKVLIGSTGNGTLTVSDGGAVTSIQQTSAGNAVGSSGTITVTGAGSTLESGLHVYVGNYGTGTLTVSDGGAVSSASGYSVYAGNASGSTGTITVTGAGSTIESGKNVFIGHYGTGTLTVSDGGAVSSASGYDVYAGNVAGSTGTINVTGAGSTIESGRDVFIGRYGTGTLTVSDSGTVTAATTLTIASQSGSTGTLNIGAAAGDAAAAPGTVSATNGIVFGAGTGEIVFNHTSTDYDFDQDIASSVTGAGTITSVAGVTNLTGDLSDYSGAYDLQGGTLNISYAGTGSQTLSNVFSGSGALSYTSGTTYLTGDSSGFTGTTGVSGTGILSVNGSLGGTTTVGSGGTLKGSGTLGGMAAASGGTVAPGNSIGTLNVSGNVAFASGSVYEVEADATSSDKIVATGTATLTGGTVSLIPYQGAFLRAGTTYTILSAAGGVTGTFDSISFSQALLFLTPSLSYDATNVYASVLRNGTRFASIAASGNQAAAANGIESLGAGNALYDAVALQGDVATARQAFQSLTGEIHANVKASIFEDQTAQSRILASRMAQSQDADGFAGSFGQAPAVAQQKRPAPVQNARDRQMMARGLYADKLLPEKPAPAPMRTDPALWAQGFGDWGRRDGDANAGAFKHQSKGLMMGVDWMMDEHWRTGLAFGYQNADYKQDDSTGATGTANRYSLSAYGGRKWGNLALRTSLTYAYSDIDTKRSVNFPYFSNALKASYEAHSVNGFAETAYAFGEAESKAEPFANLAWGYVNVPGFSEKGGAAALTAKDSSENLGATTLGVRVRQVLPFLENKAAIQASAGWMHAIGDVSPDSTLRFAGGSSFKTQAAPLARDAAAVSAGFDYLIGQQTTLGVSYTGQIGQHADTQAVRGNVSWRF